MSGDSDDELGLTNMVPKSPTTNKLNKEIIIELVETTPTLVLVPEITSARVIRRENNNGSGKWYEQPHSQEQNKEKDNKDELLDESHETLTDNNQ